MLPTRDPSLDKRLIQTESEGLETNIPSKGTGKKSKGSNTHIRQNRLQKRTIKRDPEGHFIILKGRIHQEDINIVNIHAPNIGTPKYIKKILEDFKKDIDSNTIIVGDFNTPLSKMDRSSKQNINKDTVTLINALDEIDLTDIYRGFHPKDKIHILFKCTWNIYKDRPHERTQNKSQQIQEN